MSAKRWVSFSGFLLGLALVTGGAVLGALVGWPRVQAARGSSAWPSAPGEITEFEVVEQHVDDTRTYGVTLAYRYFIDGETLEGTNIRFGGDYRSDNPAPAKELAEKYAVGQRVDVYYDPERPALSVLEPGGALGSYAILTLGVAIACVGLVLMIPLVVGMFTGGAPAEIESVVPKPHIRPRKQAAKSDA